MSTLAALPGETVVLTPPAAARRGWGGGCPALQPACLLPWPPPPALP